MMKLWLTYLLALVLPLYGAVAEDYPAHPIRVIEPLAPASAVDVVVRIIAEHMAKGLGQPLVIENVTGASGMLGMRAGKMAKPDGYTILAVNDSVVTVLPNVLKNAGFDPRTGYVPIVQLVRLHWALVANPSFAAKDVQGLIGVAKASGGSINYASGGAGSPQHMAMELLMRAGGFKLTHVPYKGVSPAFNDVVSGNVPVMFVALPTPLQFRADNKLNILGTGDKERLAVLPDVPSIAEQGLPGFEFIAWGGLIAPAGTPPSVIAKLNSAANAALSDPEIKGRLTSIGVEVTGGSSADLAGIIAKDFLEKAQLIQSAGIGIE